MDSDPLTLAELRELEKLAVNKGWRINVLRAVRELIAVREDQDPLLIGYDLALKRLEGLRKAAEECRVYLKAIIDDELFSDEVEDGAKKHYAALEGK